ncbi:MAG TPA: putative DNA-binding domain-containing protein [Steroidobacteraceae bacterium]
MLMLRDLQRLMADTLLGTAAPDEPGPDAPAQPAPALPALVSRPLLAIHRNTCVGTLSNALSLTFPAVLRLVGAGFFDTAAQEFMRVEPPRSACLDDYGQQFPDFLAHFPHAAGLEYLADVARLEWSVSRALHAPDALPLDLASLAALDPALVPGMRFVAHPGISLLQLDTPADIIWRAVLDEDDAALRAVDPAAGPVRLLVERSQAGIEVRRMESSAWHFTQRLCAGAPLEVALAEPAAERCADFGLVLADHLASGRFVGFVPFTAVRNA